MRQTLIVNLHGKGKEWKGPSLKKKGEGGGGVRKRCKRLTAPQQIKKIHVTWRLECREMEEEARPPAAHEQAKERGSTMAVSNEKQERC